MKTEELDYLNTSNVTVNPTPLFLLFLSCNYLNTSNVTVNRP